MYNYDSWYKGAKEVVVPKVIQILNDKKTEFVLVWEYSSDGSSTYWSKSFWISFQTEPKEKLSLELDPESWKSYELLFFSRPCVNCKNNDYFLTDHNYKKGANYYDWEITIQFYCPNCNLLFKENHFYSFSL